MPRRFDTPLGRLVGAVLSWTVFAFFFVGLYQALGVVLGLGGACATGGPYEIRVECPDAVALFAPLGLFGMFLALGIAFALAGGFGMSLTAWGWPILFVGLGIQFLLGQGGGQGWVVNIGVGILFLVMGLVPVGYFVSAKALVPTLVGSRNLAGERFSFDGRELRYFGLVPTGGSSVAPTGRDWAISLGLWAVSVAAGSWLAIAAFAALAASAG